MHSQDVKKFFTLKPISPNSYASSSGYTYCCIGIDKMFLFLFLLMYMPF